MMEFVAIIGLVVAGNLLRAKSTEIIVEERRMSGNISLAIVMAWASVACAVGAGYIWGQM